MSFSNNLKKIALEFNAGLKIFKRNMGLKSTCNGAALDAFKSNGVSLFMQPLSLSLCKSRTEKLCITFPQADMAIKKNIIEPIKSIKISFELPVKSSTNTVLELPFYIEKEIKEPPAEKVINKRAKHITIIRRRKMRKHIFKKYLKKNKIQLAYKKLQRDAKRESEFQLSLKNIFSEIETYSPEKYVTDTLEKVSWKRPITRVRGYLAPKWVVEKYLMEKEEKRIINERIKECLE